jgi:hypothetical protein
MQRIVRLSLITLVIAAFTAALLVAPTPADPGPACADIVSGSSPSYTWDQSTGTGTLGFEAYLENRVAPCKNLDYTLYVVTDPGAAPQVVLTSFEVQSDGGLGFSTTVHDDDDTIYLFMTTGNGKSHVFDTAPDSATPTCTDLTDGSGNTCLTVVAGGSTGGASGFN